MHAQVRAEVEALHARKADVMRAATQAQRRELEDICARMRMAVPPAPPTPRDAPDAALSGAALCAQVTSAASRSNCYSSHTLGACQGSLCNRLCNCVERSCT